MKIVLTVLLVMTLFLWLLVLLGAFGNNTPQFNPWLAWFTCLFLSAGIIFGPALGPIRMQ